MKKTLALVLALIMALACFAGCSGSENAGSGTVADGEKVTILAEKNGYYFFQTDDGRYGWNGKKWFK